MHVATTVLASKIQQSTTDIELGAVQLQYGPVLQAKERGIKLSADELKRYPREVTLLAQQWEQLVVQRGVLYGKFENPQGSRLHLHIV